MADTIQFPDPNNPFMGIPKIDNTQLIAQNTERIAFEMDLLVGLFADYLGYELKEEKTNGNTVLRWRPIGAETPESESKEPSDS